MDLTGKDREIETTYHGNLPFFSVEVRVMKEEGDNLIMGVSMSEDESLATDYDQKRKSLDILYKPYLGAVAGLYFQDFLTPNDIREINIYDIDNAPTGSERIWQSLKDKVTPEDPS